MNLKSFGFLTAFSTLFIASNANANLLFDIYAGGFIGGGAATVFSGDDNHTENAQAYGAVFGIDIPALRLEAEYDFLTNDISNLHVGLVNAYLKMPSTLIHPYLGVGAGMIFDGKLKDLQNVNTKNAPAYQAMAGLTFDPPVLPFKIDLEARVLYSADFYEVVNHSPDLLHYDLRFKLRYIF